MLEIDIVAPIVAGAIIGLIISFLFVKHGSVNKYKAVVLGINSNNLITGITLFTIVGGIAALSGMSAIIKDTEFIMNKPYKFLLETILMGLLPTLALVAIVYLRTDKFNNTNIVESFVLFAKFAAFHVLLQISGYYRYIFSESAK
jgi:hypothetical protein